MNATVHKVRDGWRGRAICRLRSLAEGIGRSLRLHPVEWGELLVGCVACLLWYECGWADERMRFVWLVPLAVLVALALNRATEQSPWRRIYCVCWAPFVAMAWWPGVGEWIASSGYRLTLGVLAPLLLLLAGRKRDNRNFVSEAFAYVRAALQAGVTMAVVVGLFAAIFFSTVHIFGLQGRWMEHVWIWVLILSGTFCLPVLFLTWLDRAREWNACKAADEAGGRFGALLRDRIIAPAVMTYLAILWLYILKIVVTWRLPDGGVAYLVFGFTLLALLVQALYEVARRRCYGWFFGRFSLYALPVVALFWVGVARRVGEYGLTPMRVWLILCGGVMTVWVLLFLMRRTGRYLWVAWVAFAAFAAVTYVPAWNPERVALQAQEARAWRMARKLGWITVEGRLSLNPVPAADSLRVGVYRQLYESLCYVEQEAPERFNEAFGLRTSGQLLELLPDEQFRAGVLGLDDGESGVVAEVPTNESCLIAAPAVNRAIDVRNYTRLYTEVRYGSEVSGTWFANDTLCVRIGQQEPLLVVSGRELLETQIARVGRIPDAYDDGDEALRGDFLDFEKEGVRVIFGWMQLSTSDRGELRIEEVSVDLILVR